MAGYFSAFTKKPSLSQSPLKDSSVLDEKKTTNLQLIPLKNASYAPGFFALSHEGEEEMLPPEPSPLFQEQPEILPLSYHQNIQVPTTRQGLIEFKNSEGVLTQTSVYADNSLNGETVVYDSQGKILQILAYKENKLDGVCKFYDKNQQLIQEIIYKAGQFEGVTTLYKNGNVLAVIPYKKGLQEGEANYFQENGLKRLTQFFVQGKKSGLCFIYDDYGRIIKAENYINDLREGESLTYDDQGNIIIQEFYEGGKLHGPCSLYSHKGNITKVTEYRHGIPYEEP